MNDCEDPRARLEYQLRTASEAETRGVAAALATSLRGGETLALVGDLGTGKTAFTRGLAEGLGISDPTLVSSPTYVLEHIYPARVVIHHYDAYRLGSEQEFVDLGFEEQAALGAVLVIEWAEKVRGVLPAGTLWIELSLLAVEDEGDGPTSHRELRLSGLASIWGGRLAPILHSWGGA